jgi:hypothetical protein
MASQAVQVPNFLALLPLDRISPLANLQRLSVHRKVTKMMEVMKKIVKTGQTMTRKRALKSLKRIRRS